MSFGHEKLDAYRAAIEYVGWAYSDSDTDPDADVATGLQNQ